MELSFFMPSLMPFAVRTIPQFSHIVSCAVFLRRRTFARRVGDVSIFSCLKVNAWWIFSGFTAFTTWLLNTTASRRELEARRFAPCTPVQAVSPKA